MPSMHTKPPRVYPPARPMIEDTQEALFHLVDTLFQHGTVVEHNVGEGVGPYEARPSRARPYRAGPSRFGFGSG